MIARIMKNADAKSTHDAASVRYIKDFITSKAMMMIATVTGVVNFKVSNVIPESTSIRPRM